MKTPNEILDERASQYGKFHHNIIGVTQVSKSIVMTDLIPDFNTHWNGILTFGPNMLALKMVRAYAALQVGNLESYNDSIIDFFNYYNLIVDEVVSGDYFSIQFKKNSYFSQDLVELTEEPTCIITAEESLINSYIYDEDLGLLDCIWTESFVELMERIRNDEYSDL